MIQIYDEKHMCKEKSAQSAVYYNFLSIFNSKDIDCYKTLFQDNFLGIFNDKLCYKLLCGIL